MISNREFFIKTLKAEAPIFARVIKALPPDQGDYRPHEKARSAKELASQLAIQPKVIAKIVKDGLIDFGKLSDPEEKLEELPNATEANYAKLIKDLEHIKDEAWETEDAKMIGPGGEWADKKFNMSWGMLFDAIHHRGQLGTYLRAMGAKVPSIYGPSADEPM